MRQVARSILKCHPAMLYRELAEVEPVKEITAPII